MHLTLSIVSKLRTVARCPQLINESISKTQISLASSASLRKGEIVFACIMPPVRCLIDMEKAMHKYVPSCARLTARRIYKDAPMCRSCVGFCREAHFRIHMVKVDET
jgi:hypothetical protein